MTLHSRTAQLVDSTDDGRAVCASIVCVHQGFGVESY